MEFTLENAQMLTAAITALGMLYLAFIKDGFKNRAVKADTSETLIETSSTFWRVAIAEVREKAALQGETIAEMKLESKEKDEVHDKEIKQLREELDDEREKRRALSKKVDELEAENKRLREENAELKKEKEKAK